MPEVASISPLLAAPLALAILLLGAWLAATLGHLTAALSRGDSPAAALLEPLRSAATLLRQRPTTTERPDAILSVVAPAAYAASAAAALTVVPLAEHLAIADLRTGIVLFGAAEALIIVAIFLHGWAPNSHLPLIGAFRFVAVGLSYELLSMFVLIATALPAQSLQLSAIVDSQADLWNVVRQPLGLPLWLIVTLGVTFRGPLGQADGADLAGGTSLEASGRQLLLWQLARGGTLTVFCAMGAAAFLGGWHGPLLPGWLWILVKTAALMALTLWLGQRIARLPAERAMTLLWTACLPLSFVGLAIAGIEAPAMSGALPLDAAFAVFAVLAAFFGWRVFRTDSMVRASFSLLASFLCVAAIMVLLLAEYLGVALIFMMALEMTVMALFMVAFMMNPAGLNPMSMVHLERAAVGLGLAGGGWLALVAVVARFPERPVADVRGSIEALGTELLGPSMLIFETAGVALLATMVASIVLSARSSRFGVPADEGSKPPPLVPGDPSTVPDVAADDEDDDDAHSHQGGEG